MRRSGKTTRLIDEAVQALFNEGEIIIPDGRWINDEHKRGFSIQQIDKINRFIDDVYSPNGESQERFKRLLIRRLSIEHQDAFEVKGNTIKLKQHN
jgi:hypothetical protein